MFYKLATVEQTGEWTDDIHKFVALAPCPLVAVPLFTAYSQFTGSEWRTGPMKMV